MMPRQTRVQALAWRRCPVVFRSLTFDGAGIWMPLIQKRGACPVGNVYCIAALGHHPAGQCARPGAGHRDALPLQHPRQPDHVFGGEHRPRHHRARLDLLLIREHRARVLQRQRWPGPMFRPHCGPGAPARGERDCGADSPPVLLHPRSGGLLGRAAAQIGHAGGMLPA